MDKEIWTPVVGYEGVYEVSNMGRVRNRFGKIMMKRFNHKGYHRVYLTKNGEPKYVAVHRIVGKAFIPNPENKPQINHKNGVKTDNRVENIEWCTNEENLEHSMNVLHQNRGSKPVICIETGKRYCSMRQAAIGIGAKGCGGISACCNGKANTASGYHWRYADE